jgi:hypothetical protein
VTDSEDRSLLIVRHFLPLSGNIGKSLSNTYYRVVGVTVP